VPQTGAKGTHHQRPVIKLDPDVAGVFPNADAVNEALRFLIRVTKKSQIQSQNRDA